MAKSIVFVLHGIGQYTQGWMDLQPSAVPVLKEVTKSYPFFEGKSLDTYVEFVPILYDDIFEKILSTWSDLGKGLSSAIPVMPAFAQETVKYLSDANKNNWWLKTGCDVVLYWGFRLFQQRVLLRVLAQICSKIAATMAVGDTVPHYHVLAHSLGTAVAHDALYHLGTEAWLSSLQTSPLGDPGGAAAAADRDTYLNSLEGVRKQTGSNNPFDPAQFSFESITMLANVTGLIHNSGADPYQSIVRPGSAGDPGAITRNYFNVRHKFDPIAAVGAFQMPDGWKLLGGYELDLDYVYDSVLKIHEAEHYVRHPDVHLRLLSQYVAPYVPTAGDVEQCQVFEQKYGFATLSAGVRQGLQDLLEGRSGPFSDLVSRLGALSKVSS